MKHGNVCDDRANHRACEERRSNSSQSGNKKKNGADEFDAARYIAKPLPEADSLKKADAVLANAQSASADGKAAAANIKGATTDLAALRTEVDDSIRKVGVLIDEINRRWPFARKNEIKLP